MGELISGRAFPALAPNAADLPYPVRPRSFALYGTGALYAVFALGAGVVGISMFMRPSNTLDGTLVSGVVVLLIGAFSLFQLWRLYRPDTTLYSDRIEKRALFGPWRVLHRNEIKGVGPNVYNRSGSYFEILPISYGAPIRLPASARKDPVVATWLAGAPDPDAEQRAKERAAVLADPRFGATATVREAGLSRAKTAVTAFTLVCLPLAYWAGMFPQPYWVGISAAILAPLIGLVLIRVFDGLVLWMGASKIQPQVGIVSITPLLGLAFGAMTRNRLYDPFTFGAAAGVLGVVAGTIIFLSGEQTKLRRSYAIVGGLCVAAAIFGLGSLLDQALDLAPAKIYPVLVLDKHETHGRSAANYLNLAGWPGRPPGDVEVSDALYAVPINGHVCAHSHGGAFALPWFELTQCPERILSATQPDTLADRLARYYPDRAQRLEVEGSAVVECQVSEAHLVNHCKAISETPPGYGFGEAAVRIMDGHLVKPSPGPDHMLTARTTIRFRLRD